MMNIIDYTMEADLADIRNYPENIVNYDIESDYGIEFLKAAAGENRAVLKYLPEHIRNDEYVMLRLIEVVPAAAGCCGQLKFDREFMFRAIEANAAAYVFAPGWVRSDRQLSIEALKKKHGLISCVSPELIGDIEFVQMCIKADFKLYPVFFYNRGFTDEEKVYLLAKEGRIAGYMTDLLKDEQTAMKVSAANPFVAKCIPESFRSDRAFTTRLLEQNGLALKYMGSDAQSDRELVTIAVRNNAVSFLSASDELKNDRDFVLELIKANWFVFKLADPFKNDEEMALEAVNGNVRAANYIGSFLKNDEGFMSRLLEEFPEAERFTRQPVRSMGGSTRGGYYDEYIHSGRA